MGFKLALIMFVVMGVVGGIAYWYYHDTQEKIAILHENNAKLEVKVIVIIGRNMKKSKMIEIRGTPPC